MIYILSRYIPKSLNCPLLSRYTTKCLIANGRVAKASANFERLNVWRRKRATVKMAFPSCSSIAASSRANLSETDHSIFTWRFMHIFQGVGIWQLNESSEAHDLNLLWSSNSMEVNRSYTFALKLHAHTWFCLQSLVGYPAIVAGTILDTPPIHRPTRPPPTTAT